MTLPKIGCPFSINTKNPCAHHNHYIASRKFNRMNQQTRLCILSLLLLTACLQSFSQNNPDTLAATHLIDLGEVTNSNEDFSSFEPLKETLKNGEIVMLGEQSHTEGTVFETKIKLIKFLHQEMGFDLLVFESGLYDCTTGWEKIKNGEEVRTTLAKSSFYIWSATKEFIPLAAYIESNKNSKNPLIISGFDSQFTGRISAFEFVDDLKTYLASVDTTLLESQEWTKLEKSLQSVLIYDTRAYEKEQAARDTAFINTLSNQIIANDSAAMFWTQVLKNTKYLISDMKLGTNFRDRQMAENLVWIKEQNPGKKIICWGATSHFLYNSSEIRLIGFPYNLIGRYYRKQPMMGHYIKEKYQSKVFTIGFVAYQGTYGFNRTSKIKPPGKNSLEYTIGSFGLDNCFLSFENFDSGEMISRPLGNKYMKNKISNVMDGVIFNRNVARSHLDHDFTRKVYIQNTASKPNVVNE